MKKITLLFAIFVFFGAQAQEVQRQVIQPDKGAKVAPHFRTSKEAKGWLFPAWDLFDNFYGGDYTPVSHYANVIFPDSTTVYLASDGSREYSWLHSFGAVLDPYSDIYTASQKIPLGAPYYLDSLVVLAWYEKVAPTASAVDTLVAEIVYGPPQRSPAFRSVYLPVQGSDTLFFSPPAMETDSSQLYGWQAKLADANKVVIKYPLTNNDTTMNLGKFITIPVGGLKIPYDDTTRYIIGVSFTFVPGYTYNFGDTLFSYGGNTFGTKNTFRAGLYATDDLATNPDLFYDPYGYFNLGYYINNLQRYKIYTNTLLHEIMYPLTDWGFDVGFHLSIGTGIGDVEKGRVNVYPNPAHGEVNIQLAQKGDAQIQVISLIGEVVRDARVSDLVNVIDMGNLNAGIYMVRVIQGEQVYTSKVILK